MRRHRGGLTAHHNRAEPQYSRPGAPIHPEQPRGTKATTTRLTIAGNRKFESPSLQRRVTQTSSANARSRPDASEIPGLRAAVLNVRIHLSTPESLRTIGLLSSRLANRRPEIDRFVFHVIDRPGRPFTAETQTRRWRELDLNFRSLEEINGIL